MKPSAFSPSSRYYPIEVAQHQPTPEGPTVAYLRRRFVPSPSRFSTLVETTVKEGDRLDNITATFLGDPEQFWRLCDANVVLRPEELTDTPGRRVRVTLPEGIVVAPNA